MPEELKIRLVQEEDKAFWFALDNHISQAELNKKIRDGQGYILSAGNKPVGILRYNLFWDNTPFCTMLAIEPESRGRGFGKALMRFWEEDMKKLGYKWIMTSTQSDEDAQNFYRGIGYYDCGYLIAPGQAAELFLGKHI